MMKTELIDILVAKSLKVADRPIFELASGNKSNIYIDAKITTCNARGKVIIGNLIFDRISKLNVVAIGGLTLGADPIANAVSYTSGIRGCPINTFIVRKTPKGHGLKKVIEGDVKKGDRVIIVDDVVTTGASTIEAIQKTREFGLQVIKVIVLVDRQEGGKENILKENIDFEAIITKEELLDAYYKGTDSERSLSGQSLRVDRILQNSL
ncbi:MAG: orotate phosphoribosyltransferase [Deltaproteobacteria bacterium]|nr:orotate phosphoribosyltransferase [Deltaproteobacteria bacterium]